MPHSVNSVPAPVVLAVDDSKDDLLLVDMAARKASPWIDFRTLDKGEEAIAYISGSGKYSDRAAHPLPRLMLLDLKMPCVSGFDVLTALSKARTPKPPFICILTTSKLPEDIAKATALGADAFHMKPGNFADFCDLLRRLTEFFCIANMGSSN